MTAPDPAVRNLHRWLTGPDGRSHRAILRGLILLSTSRKRRKESQ